MQVARFLVQEKRNRHAPGALTADNPVRPVGDHVAQAGLSVFGVETGLLNGLQRQLTQSLGRLVLSEHAFALIHANEPLRGGAVDHRRLVPPAVRVAVHDVGCIEQAACVAQGVDDDGHGLPDIEAAKQREIGRVAAVGLHRIEDVFELEAVRDAAVEVVQTICGCRMHDASAVFVGGVVGQIDGRKTPIAQTAIGSRHVVQRVLEMQHAELFALAGTRHFTLQLEAGEAFFNQRIGKN